MRETDLAVGEQEVVELALIDAGVQRAPGGAARADHVLVRDREEVSLLDRELLGGGGRHDQLAHDLAHILITLGSLGRARHEDERAASILALEVLGLDNEGRTGTSGERRGELLLLLLLQLQKADRSAGLSRADGQSCRS